MTWSPHLSLEQNFKPVSHRAPLCHLNMYKLPIDLLHYCHPIFQGPGLVKKLSTSHKHIKVLARSYN